MVAIRFRRRAANQGDFVGGDAGNRRLRRLDRSTPDWAEHCRPDAVRVCHAERDVCDRIRRRQRHADVQFNGVSYPFTLVGAVVGPGGAERVTASGEVYKLANVQDFAGRYTQFSGSAGLSRGGAGELWLENNAGVIMHLYSQTQGVLLSLGKEEVVIRLNR
jgi:hypothetical protein